MPLVHAKDVGDLLGISAKQIYNLSRDGIIPVVRVGRLLRFDLAKITRWIEDGGKGYDGAARRGCRVSDSG